jgi:hypothetical protein
MWVPEFPKRIIIICCVFFASFRLAPIGGREIVREALGPGMRPMLSKIGWEMIRDYPADDT